jgi:pentatricopeptide repeat protein
LWPGVVQKPIGACGRAGKATKALELFDAMKSEGLQADRVAFNALFSALRMAKNPDKVRQGRF